MRAGELIYDGEFNYPSIGDSKKHHICEVFVPEMKTSLFGIVKSFGSNQILAVELLHIDTQREHQLKKLNHYFMKWDNTHKQLEVRLCPLIRPIFEASHPVTKQDICVFFVPGIGVFDVFVHEEMDTECEIQFVDTSADETVKKACKSLDDKYFKKSATQGHFVVKREFLRQSDVTDNQPLYSRYDSSKYENDVEMIDVTEHSYDMEQEKSVVASNGNQQNDILMEYMNKLCSVDENYMLNYCSKKEHYGTVFDGICKGSHIFVGIELIEHCDCRIVCDGKFEGKCYTVPKPRKCLFVNISALEIIPFSVSEINIVIPDDVCEIFVPMTDRKVYFGVYNKGSYNTGRCMVKMLEDCRIQGGATFVYEKYDTYGSIELCVNKLFLNPVFRPTVSIVRDKCDVFIPRKGIFHGIALERTLDTETVKWQYKVSFSQEDTALLKRDKTFIQYVSDSTFLVSSLLVRESTKHDDEDVGKTQALENEREQIGDVERSSSSHHDNNESKNGWHKSDMGKHEKELQSNLGYNTGGSNNNSHLEDSKIGNDFPELPCSSDTQQLPYNSPSKQCSTGAYPKTSPNSAYTKSVHNHMDDNGSHKQHGYGEFQHQQEFQSSSSLLNRNNAMALYPSVTSGPQSLPYLDSSDKNWRIKIGDFCSVDKGYMARLCKNKGHYGFVFMVYPSSTKQSEREKPPIVGLKLINSCECATVGDGTYQGQLMLENPCPARCLFPSLKKVNLIEFEKSTLPDFNIDDVCQVYMPSIEQHCYAFIRNVDRNVLEVQLLDSSCQYNESFDEVNIKYQQNYVKGPIVVVKIFQNFVKSLFRCSPVTNGDICQLFVPGQDKFQCLVEGRNDDGNYRVTVLEGNIDMSKVNIDEHLFKKIDDGQFNVNQVFLRCMQSTTAGVKGEASGIDEATDFLDDDSEDGVVLEPDEVDKKPKPFVTRKTNIGKFKGIQGHNNSCYMDSLLYSLFLFNDSLDKIFELKSDDDLNHYEMKNHFRRLIVNPLRSDKCFVRAVHVMQIREMLEDYLPGVTKEEKDAEELLSVLFSKNFAGKNGYPPLLHLNNVLLDEEQHLFVYQIFVEAENDEEFSKMQKSIPHVADILAQSFVLQGQFLSENPQTFLIQLPRFGKEKLFPGVYLPAELNISEISAHGRPKCCICEEPAVLRCRECTLQKSAEKFAFNSGEGMFSIITYCQTCFDLRHKTKNHQIEKLQLSKPAFSSKASSLYSLEAVICIETSHYVSFVRARKEKPEGEFCWLFFDSMADRVEKSGVEQNVPIVRATSNIGAHLLKLDSLNPEQRYEYVVSHSYTKEDEHFKRLVQDAYICVYKQKEMASPKPTYASAARDLPMLTNGYGGKSTQV